MGLSVLVQLANFMDECYSNLVGYGAGLLVSERRVTQDVDRETYLAIRPPKKTLIKRDGGWIIPSEDMQLA
jgi:hypothetical protein